MDREAAEEALAALPRYAPLPPPGVHGTDVDLVIGVAYELSGDAKTALPYLERAVRSCNALDNPWAHLYAQMHLGSASALNGDIATARTAYQQVLEAWSKAEPRSIRAEQTATALRELDAVH